MLSQVKASKYGSSIIDIITSHMPLWRRMLPPAGRAAPAAALQAPAVASAAEAAVCAEPPAAASHTSAVAPASEAVCAEPPAGTTQVQPPAAVVLRLQTRAEPPSPPWGRDEDAFFTQLGGEGGNVLGMEQAGLNRASGGDAVMLPVTLKRQREE